MAADKAAEHRLLPLFAASHCLPLGGNKKRVAEESTHTTDSRKHKALHLWALSPRYHITFYTLSKEITPFGRYPHY